MELGKGLRSNDSDGFAPPRLAAFNNKCSASRASLELRASGNANGNDGLTPHEVAAANDAEEEIRLFWSLITMRSARGWVRRSVIQNGEFL